MGIYNDRLDIFCEDNSVILKYDYSDEKLNELSKIEGYCKTENCENEFNIICKSLLNNGGLCTKCSINRRRKFTYDNLKIFCDDNNIELQEDYSDVNLNGKSFIKGNCLTKNCDKHFKKQFRALLELGAYCTECAKDNKEKNISDFTNIKNYVCVKNGTSYNKKNITTLKKIKDDDNVTFLEDYSYINLNQKSIIKGICLTENCGKHFKKQFRGLLETGAYCTNCSDNNKKDKSVATSITRYGCKWSCQSEEVKEKMVNTNIKKYGCKSPSQTKEAKEKMANTNMERYGCKSASQTKEAKEKMADTNMERYGCKSASQTKEAKEKMADTNMERYGVKSVMQNSEIAEKNHKNAFKLKSYAFPSGNIINCQGYEPFALDELINGEELDENDIITSRKEVPEIWYFDVDGIKRRYYMDIFLKSQNRCIEVKSEWTFQLNPDTIKRKHEAVQNAGYLSEVWVYNKKGRLVDFLG